MRDAGGMSSEYVIFFTAPKCLPRKVSPSLIKNIFPVDESTSKYHGQVAAAKP